MAPRFGGAQQQSRPQAMVQIAVHDALHSIDPRYDRYTSLRVVVPGASPEAAVAAAARRTLLGLLTLVPDSAAIVSGPGLDPWEHARLFALLNIAQADALIANQTRKYTYTFWRPVTAIRWADDGNPDTESDPLWRPFLVTPPYPDYPCALPSATAAAAEVLREFLGRDQRGLHARVSRPGGSTPGTDGAITGEADYAQLHNALGCRRGSPG